MLEVNANLQLTIDGHVIAFTANGTDMRAEVVHPLHVLRALGVVGTLDVARRVAALLFRYGATLTITRAGKPIAVLGESGGMVGTLLRAKYVRFFR